MQEKFQITYQFNNRFIGKYNSLGSFPAPPSVEQNSTGGEVGNERAEATLILYIIFIDNNI